MKFERHYDLCARRERWCLTIGHTRYTSFRTLLGHPWATLVGRMRAFYAMRDAALGGCEHCGSFWRLDWRGSHTAYHWDGTGEDPNRDRWYCEPCAGDAAEYWEEMWAEWRFAQG